MPEELFQISTVNGPTFVMNPVPGWLLATTTPVMLRNRETLEPRCIGSAFCVSRLANGQAIYVTAKHVIDSLLDGADSDPEPFLLVPQNTSDPERNELVGIQIDQIATADSHCDVAMLRIDLRTAVESVAPEFKTFSIALKPATIAQKTLAFGYSRMEIDQSGASVYRDLRVSEGVVEEIHDSQRDSSLSTFPSFRTDALYMPGMSGGPVFNQQNGVIGVVSHGMIPEDGSAHYGYAASIGGLAELRIDLEQDDGVEREFTMPELLAAGAIRTAPDSGVTINRSESGVQLVWMSADAAAGN